MTYIDLINRFWKMDLEYNFSHLEVHLYFKLLEIANRSGWRKKLSMPNKRLCALIDISEKYLIRARQRLNDTELIKYEKGTTRKAGNYSIDPDYFHKESNKASNKKDYLHKESKVASNQASNQGNIYKNRKDKDKEKSKDKEAAEKIPYEQIKKLFNSICKSQSKVLKISPERKKHIKARWNWLDSLEEWESLFKRIEASSFLRESSGKNWMSFDWILNETNMTKILEGKYDDKEVSNGGFSSSSRKANEKDRFKNPSGESTNYDELEELLVCNSD